MPLAASVVARHAPTVEAVAKRLGDAQDVRPGVRRPLVGEELAGAAETALDLIQDQQGALLRCNIGAGG